MVSALPAALILILAAGQPAAAFIWTLGPPPPLPPLPKPALASADSQPRLQPRPVSVEQLSPSKPVLKDWQLVAQTTKPRWEIVQANRPRWEIVPAQTPTPDTTLALAPAPLRWERVPTQERILHSDLLAIVTAPAPMELVLLDARAPRWESVPAPQATYPVAGSIESSAVRPVLGRRVWFRF